MGTLPPFPPLTTGLVATVFWLRATDQRTNSWLSEVYVDTNSVIQINKHNYQQSRQFRLPSQSYSVSTDNPVIMFIFPINSLPVCWGNLQQ